MEVTKSSKGPPSQNSKCGVCVDGHVRETWTSRRSGAGAWRWANTLLGARRNRTADRIVSKLGLSLATEERESGSESTNDN